MEPSLDTDLYDDHSLIADTCYNGKSQLHIYTARCVVHVMYFTQSRSFGPHMHNIIAHLGTLPVMTDITLFYSCSLFTLTTDPLGDGGLN